MMAAAAFALLVFLPCLAALAQTTTVDVAASLAAQFSLTSSTTLPFPTATLATSDAQSYIISGWTPSLGRIIDGADDLAFVSDPFPGAPIPGAVVPGGNTSAPVLAVTYPAGSYSNNTGGAQVWSVWDTPDNAVFQSMLLSYEVAFDAGFNFVMGGKLPGLRGGPEPFGCSGGHFANGTNCFSTRIMWRTDGAGEVYAYIPTVNHLCTQQDVLCDDDYGISLGRGLFNFTAGEWNRITLLVGLNSPGNLANGFVTMYHNDVQAITHNNLQFRSSDVVTIGGLYLSTFFGGNDTTWATPVTTQTYFRRFRLWGGTQASNQTGVKVSAAQRGKGRPNVGVLVTGGATVGLVLVAVVM